MFELCLFTGLRNRVETEQTPEEVLGSLLPPEDSEQRDSDDSDSSASAHVSVANCERGSLFQHQYSICHTPIGFKYSRSKLFQ